MVQRCVTLAGVSDPIDLASTDPACSAPADALAALSVVFSSLGRVLLCLDHDQHVVHASRSLDRLLGPGSADDTIGKLKVVSLLESLPGVGKVKARKIMDEIGIADNRRVQGLGQQQKAALLEQLGK